MSKILGVVSGVALLTMASVAFAAEPVTLTSTQLDTVTAGGHHSADLSAGSTSGCFTVWGGCYSGTYAEGNSHYVSTGGESAGFGFIVFTGSSSGVTVD